MPRTWLWQPPQRLFTKIHLRKNKRIKAITTSRPRPSKAQRFGLCNRSRQLYPRRLSLFGLGLRHERFVVVVIFNDDNGLELTLPRPWLCFGAAFGTSVADLGSFFGHDRLKNYAIKIWKWKIIIPSFFDEPSKTMRETKAANLFQFLGHGYFFKQLNFWKKTWRRRK